ncbi:MAG: CHASE3 domain-containing protein [Chthoniobacter sp.]|nr:CHASE3 domain-containing protein [Chthoniobacter sp.]
MPYPPPVPPRFSIRRKIVIGFGLVFLMLGIIGFISYRSTRAFILTADWVAHTREVMEIQERTQRHLMEMESGRRAFLMTGDEGYLRGFEDAQSQIIENFNALKTYTADTPQQTLKLDRLLTLIQRNFAQQQMEIETRRTQGFAASLTVFSKGESTQATQDIRKILADFDREQRALLAERAALTRYVGRATTLTIMAGSIFTFIALLVACILILRDVAARHRAEEALAAEHHLLLSIIDTIPDHVYVKDVEGRFILDNIAHRDMYGPKTEGTTTGRTVFDYYSAADAERFDEDDHRVIETGEGIFNHEEPREQEDGSELWIQTTKVPLRDTDGSIIGLVGISADISDRKAAEAQLLRFAYQLESSNAELQNFASVASHDLQEPLRKIQAFSDRLRVKCGASLNAQGLDYLERMQNAAQRMQVLIQDLLKLSRITSRALPFEQCNLNEIVRAVLTDLELMIEQKNAEVEIGDLPTIEADPVQMRQLFQNLISNALKFQRPGEKPEVVVEGRIYEMKERNIVEAAAGPRICKIVVRDNGIGFDPKFGEQIFVVFQRLHSRSEFEGTGIGLAVCRKITDRHGGSIVAKSAEGQGAAFIVTLPVTQPSPQANE